MVVKSSTCRRLSTGGLLSLVGAHLWPSDRAFLASPDVLINPYGLNYDEVTASNLVRIDIDGNIVGDSNYPVNQAGFVIHSAVHCRISAGA